MRDRHVILCCFQYAQQMLVLTSHGSLLLVNQENLRAHAIY